MPERLRVWAVTDRGMVRRRNQDAVLAGGWIGQTDRGVATALELPLGSPVVCAVADGLGGHAGGDIASKVALAALAEQGPDWQDADDVRRGVNAIDRHVAAFGQDPRLSGLGTTLAGVVVDGLRLLCFNVGDSRLYQLRGGSLEQLSTDDSVLSSAGRPTSYLTQALGDASSSLEPHVWTMDLDPRARLLICTDGVTGPLSTGELCQAVRQPEGMDLVDELVSGVREAGAPDNFSIVVIEATATRTARASTPARKTQRRFDRSAKAAGSLR